MAYHPSLWKGSNLLGRVAEAISQDLAPPSSRPSFSTMTPTKPPRSYPATVNHLHPSDLAFDHSSHCRRRPRAPARRSSIHRELHGQHVNMLPRDDPLLNMEFFVPDSHPTIPFSGSTEVQQGGLLKTFSSALVQVPIFTLADPSLEPVRPFPPSTSSPSTATFLLLMLAQPQQRRPLLVGQGDQQGHPRPGTRHRPP